MPSKNQYGEPLKWKAYHSVPFASIRRDDGEEIASAEDEKTAARIVAAMNLCAGHEDLSECVVVRKDVWEMVKGVLAESGIV